MLERFSTVLLAIPLVAALALVIGTPESTRGPARPSSPPAATTVRAAPADGSALGEGQLQITGAGFAYCNFDEDCGQTSVLRIGKSPMQFVISTAACQELVGADAEFSIEVLTLEKEAVFETSFQLPLKYTNQRSALLYKQQPRAIAGLEPGKYRYRVGVMTLDGDHQVEWERVVLARK